MIAAQALSSGRPEQLWGVVARVTAWPRFVPTFTAVTALTGADAVAPGARYRVRQPGLAPAMYEVTGCIAGRSFTWVARLPGLTTTATHTVRPDGAGSRVELGVSWSGILAPLARVLLARRAARMIGVEARALAEAVDAGRA